MVASRSWTGRCRHTAAHPRRTGTRSTVEAFLVLDGELTFTLDGERTAVAAGGFVIVSEGEAHTFVNDAERRPEC